MSSSAVTVDVFRTFQIEDAMFAFPQPHYMPCADCGASVARGEAQLHVCESERRLDFAIVQLRGELQEFDVQLAAYLETARGRFEAWYAANRR
jgi:hypothetical protein